MPDRSIERKSYGTVRLLDRGVVTILKAVRDDLGWGPGTPVRISETAEGIVIERIDEAELGDRSRHRAQRRTK